MPEKMDSGCKIWRLQSGRLDSRHLDPRFFGLRARLGSGRLDTRRLDTWILSGLALKIILGLDTWILDLWTLGSSFYNVLVSGIFQTFVLNFAMLL